MRILIADDEQLARTIAELMVNKFGHESVVVDNGRDALDVLLADDPPRIAILDWVMPGMDGVDICKALQSNANAPFIYTILLTGRNEMADLIEAFENGAYDFITKPVEPEELRCRIQVGIRLVEAEDKLMEYGTSMDTLAKQRAEQLLHADRLATIGAFTASVVHDLASPITCVTGCTELLNGYWESLLPHVKSSPLPDAARGRVDMIPELMQKLDVSCKSIMHLIDRMRRYSRRKTDTTEICNVHTAINNALTIAGYRLKHVDVSIMCPDTLPDIAVVGGELEQVLINLLVNASDAMETVDTRQIEVSAHEQGNKVVITVQDSGPGIPTHKMDEVFESFYTTKPPDKGTGLGLAICREFTNRYDGTITVENCGGARFSLALPAAGVNLEQKQAAASARENGS